MVTSGLSRLFRHHESLLLGVTVVVCVLIGALNPAFYSLGNSFDLLKSCVTLGILACGALVVLVSGGIDISFPATAACCMYVTCTIALRVPALDHFAALMALSIVIGLAIGLINAFFIHTFRLPALIVTLGTASVIRGALLQLVGTRTITNLPSSIIAFSQWSLVRQILPSGETIGLTGAILFLVAVAFGVAGMLRYSVVGRGIYAFGADPAAAERVGFDIGRIQAVVYGLMGALAGLVGIIHASVIRNANPKDLEGLELTVIAAAVIGGASITGGRGTVAGTLLGVLLMVVMSGSLVLIGLPSQWHQVFIGLVVVTSTSVTALRARSAAGAGFVR